MSAQPLANVSNTFLQQASKQLAPIGDESIRYAGPRRLIKKKKDAAALHQATQQQQQVLNGTLRVGEIQLVQQHAYTPVPPPPKKPVPTDDTIQQSNNAMLDSEEVGTMLGDYQLMEAIGKGGFGIVYRGLNIATGRTVAIKRISLYGIPADELEGIEAEITLLKNLTHLNIVLYYDSIRTDKHLNIVLEYCENGSLSTLLNKMGGKLPEPLVSHYTAQVLNGLQYLHTQGVIHRDIKGANILATKDGLIKLADFGVATKLNDTMKSDSVVGTPYWMAPEIIEMSGQQSSACDIWSVGCTVIELLTGKPPYFDMQQMPALFRIVQDEHPPLPDNISPQLQDFLLQCFQKDPNRRIDAQGLLKHSWLKKSVDKQQALLDNTAVNSKKVKTNNTIKPNVDSLELDSDEDWDAEIEQEQTHVNGNTNVNALTSAQLITPDIVKQLLNKQAANNATIAVDTNLQSPNRSTSLALSPSKLELSPWKPSDLINSKAVVARKPSAAQPTALLEIDDNEIDDTTILDGIDDDTDIILQSNQKNNNDIVRRTLTNVVKPRALKDFMESDDGADEYEFDELSEHANMNDRQLTLARHHIAQHSDNRDDIFDDTFDTSISETSINSVKFYENELREPDSEHIDPNVTKQITRLYNSLLISSDSEQLCEILNKFSATVQNNSLACNFMLTLGCTQLIDMLAYQSHNVVFNTLKLINVICASNSKYQYMLCINGLLPILITLCDQHHTQHNGTDKHSSITLKSTELVYLTESIQFCATLLHTNTDICKQLFMSTNSIRILIHALYLSQEQLLQHMPLLLNTINCINYIFAHVTLVNKNTLCKMFIKHNLLQPLTTQLHHICTLQQQINGSQYKQLIAQILHILTLYSNGDQSIKQYTSQICHINNILLVLQLNYKTGKYNQYVDNNTITTLLKLMKNLSMDSTTLDNMESTCTISTVLLYLPQHNASEHQTTVLLTMYYLCQIKQSRQEQAALHGIVPHLMRIIRSNNPLKQFAYPIIMLLGKSTAASRYELKKYNAIEFYLWCLNDIYWCVMSMEVLCIWLQHDKIRTEHILQQQNSISKLVKCFQMCAQSSQQQYEGILPIIRKIVSDSVLINLALGANTVFVQQLCSKLQQTSTSHNNNSINNIRVNLLKIIALLVIPTDTRALKYMLEYNLVSTLQQLARDKSSVIVEKLAQKLLDTRFSVVSSNNNNGATVVKKSLVTSSNKT